MNVRVMRRGDAVRYSFRPHEEKAIVISISTPGMNYGTKVYPSSCNGIKGVLRLYFDDVEDGEECITKEHVKAVKRFVEFNSGCDVIVHCDAGISRSAGIAAALMKHYNGDDSPIFDNPRYVPNMRCYSMMLNELEAGA